MPDTVTNHWTRPDTKGEAAAMAAAWFQGAIERSSTEGPVALTDAIETLDDESLGIALGGLQYLQELAAIAQAYAAIQILKRGLA